MMRLTSSIILQNVSRLAPGPTVVGAAIDQAYAGYHRLFSFVVNIIFMKPLHAFTFTVTAAGLMIIAGLLANDTVVVACEPYESQVRCSARAAALVK